MQKKPSLVEWLLFATALVQLINTVVSHPHLWSAQGASTIICSSYGNKIETIRSDSEVQQLMRR